MKTKIFSLIILIVAGLAVVYSLVSKKASVTEEYNMYIQKATANAEKEIPYNAVKYYNSAFKVKCDDEAEYIKYIEQCEKLGKDFLSSAVESYIEKFPQSVNAYETICKFYYDLESYDKVLKYANEAKEKNLVNDTIRNMYQECSMMYKVLKSDFEEVSPFLGGYAKVMRNGKYGIIDGDTNFKFSTTYDDLSYFVNGSISVFNEEWYIANENGYKVARTSVPVDFLSFISNDMVLFGIDGKYDYMDRSLQVPEKLRFEDATNYKGGVAAVKYNGKWGLIDLDGNRLTEFVYDDVIRDEFNSCLGSGIIFAKQNDKYIMINAAGERVGAESFDDARLFAGDEPAAICQNGKWGFVNSDGTIFIAPKYEDAKSFCIGLAPVCVDGVWGYINKAEETKLEFKYEDCLQFSNNGVTAVKEKDRWSYIKLLPFCQ